MERHLQNTCDFLQYFDGWNDVSVLDRGDVTPDQTGPHRQLDLGELFSFTNCTNAITNYHCGFGDELRHLPMEVIYTTINVRSM